MQIKQFVHVSVQIMCISENVCYLKIHVFVKKKKNPKNQKTNKQTNNGQHSIHLDCSVKIIY